MIRNALFKLKSPLLSHTRTKCRTHLDVKLIIFIKIQYKIKYFCFSAFPLTFRVRGDLPQNGVHGHLSDIRSHLSLSFITCKNKKKNVPFISFTSS